LVADFLKSDADTLLFVDADVVVTADAVLRLLALSLDKDITAGIYPRRGMDRKFFLDYYLDEQGALEFDKNGLLRVKRIGTGFMMIQRHVLETMIAKHPEWNYFNNVDNRTDSAIFDLKIVNGEYYGEDYLFCDRATEDGFTVYLDPSISLPHVGQEKFIRDFIEDVLQPLLAEHCTPKLKVVNGN
jgi:GT2 family glycosyltransferase